MSTVISFSSFKKSPIAMVCIACFLTACGGGAGDTTSNSPSYAIVADPADYLPANQAVTISETFLADKFSDAFQLALNSPDDKITLTVKGKIEVPLPIPDVPPGLLNGGIEISKVLEISVTDDLAAPYEVSFEKDAGLNFAAKVPDLPKGNEISAGVTTSYSKKNVFRFSSPTDAAKGILDYFILKGVWQEMNALGLNPSGIGDIADNMIKYVSSVTGLNFGLDAAQLNTLLNAATAALAADQAALTAAQAVVDADTVLYNDALAVVNAAQAVVNTKTQLVNAAQAKYNSDNCNNVSILNGNVAVCALDTTALAAAKAALAAANAALALAKKTLATYQLALADAQATLNQWTDSVNTATLAVQNYQTLLSNLPPDTSVVSFNGLVTKVEDALTFLNQSYKETELKISKGTTAEAKADVLGGVDAGRTRSFSLKFNPFDKTISVSIKFSGETTLDASAKTKISDQIEIKEDKEIEYELGFVWDPQAQQYALKDKGKFTIDVDLSGAVVKGGDSLNRKSGAGIKPILEFSPGQELTEFGANATGIIDLTPILGIINNLDTIDTDTLRQAVDSTVQSFQLDQLITAISKQTLPLKIKFYRIAGLKTELSGGQEFKGTFTLSADWNNYGQTLDLSDMTVADYVNKAFDHDGLTANLDKLVTAIESAYQDSLAIN